MSGQGVVRQRKGPAAEKPRGAAAAEKTAAKGVKAVTAAKTRGAGRAAGGGGGGGGKSEPGGGRGEPAVTKVPLALRLTDRQCRIIEVIQDSIDRRGYPPSMREIGEAVGLNSTSSVRHQLVVLENKGFIRRDPNRPRAYIVRGPSDPTQSWRARMAQTAPQGGQPAAAAGDHPQGRMQSAISTLGSSMAAGAQSALAALGALGGSVGAMEFVPLVGRIAAGGPILAEESIEELIPMPRAMVSDGTLFALTVVGDSMIEAGIMDGDTVVVRQQQSAESGQIVAAMIDGEATVKQLKIQRDEGRYEVWLMPRNPSYDPIPGDNAVVLGRVVTVMRRL
ncbi:transcriptional repressor LexA [Actinospica robiniae]|uniref:transcriptional repressor LexA n=1 Tax=Actinospica robiniae TaxID=304901 RepID=UPI00041806F5|nr:transcriptional repressor LexA [Actinospica robiniae]